VTARERDSPPTLAEHLRATAGVGSSLVAVLEALAGAGGRLAREIARAAFTGRLDYHQRTPLYIGSTREVGWAERCHRETAA
jgi:fructose-1,6-bisphosphatase